jgi:hypothetical protein
MSAPAQKDLSPVPVIIRTLILSSAPTMSIAVDNSDITSLFRAFSTSGLLIFIIAISLSLCKSSSMYFIITADIKTFRQWL